MITDQPSLVLSDSKDLIAGYGHGSIDSMGSYLRDIGRVPLLSNEQEITLGRQVQELMYLENLQKDLQGNESSDFSLDALSEKTQLSVPEIKKKLRRGRRAKERMVASNLRLVVSVAKKYTMRDMDLLDLIQEGTIGLVRGVEKFDPSRGYKFSTYAYWWIRQGITRALAEKSRIIRLPIHITELLNKLKKAQRDLSQQLSRTPTIKELANYLDLTEEEVKDLLSRSNKPISLEMKVGDGETTSFVDILMSEEELPSQKLEFDCLKGDLNALLDRLPALQSRVLKLRYGIEGESPMSLTGIGRTLGISRDRVRNLERRGLSELRNLGEYVENYFVA